MDPAQDILTIAEVAAIIRVPTKVVEDLVCSGFLAGLPGLTGEHTRIRRKALDDYLNGRTSPQTANMARSAVAGTATPAASPAATARSEERAVMPAQGPGGMEYVRVRSPARPDGMEWPVRADFEQARQRAGLSYAGTASHGLRLEYGRNGLFFLENIRAHHVTIYVLPTGERPKKSSEELEKRLKAAGLNHLVGKVRENRHRDLRAVQFYDDARRDIGGQMAALIATAV